MEKTVPTTLAPGAAAPTQLSFGETIKARRMQYGMSLRDLAAKVHVHHATIDRIESGYFKSTTPETIVALAEALHYDPQYLLSLCGAGIADSDIRYINRAARKMTARERCQMLELLIKMYPDAFAGVEDDDLDNH